MLMKHESGEKEEKTRPKRGDSQGQDQTSKNPLEKATAPRTGGTWTTWGLSCSVRGTAESDLEKKLVTKHG